MGRVYAHGTLEAFAQCAALGADTLKPRHSKEGPSRQGQLWHAWSSLYFRHLLATKRVSDFDEGRRIMNALISSVTADDEDGVASVIEDHLEVPWLWFLQGTAQETEQTHFVTMDRRRVPPERVIELSAPVFRYTADLTWRGQGPYPTDYHALGGDGVANLMDWKLYHHVEHVSSPTNNRQLKRYCAAHFPDEDGVCAWLGFPRRGYFEHDTYGKANLDAFWQTHVVEPIMRIEDAADKGLLSDARTVGAHCSKCDMRRGCDAALRYPYDLAGAESSTPEQRLVAMKLAKAIADDHEAALRGALAMKGEVVDGEHRFHYIERRQVDYNPERVVEVLKEHLAGSQLRRAFGVTKTSLTKAMKEAGLPRETADALLAACAKDAPVKLSTAVHTSKLKEERPDGAGNRRRRRPEGVGDVE